MESGLQQVAKSRAELLEEYKKKKVLGVSSSGNLNSSSGGLGGKLLKPTLQKKIKGKSEGNHLQFENNVNKMMDSERKNAKPVNMNVGKSKSSTMLAATNVSIADSPSPSSSTIIQQDDNLADSVSDAFADSTSSNIESFQDAIHLKIELEAKDGLVQDLRNENLNLLTELTNVQNQLLDFKERNEEIDTLNAQVEEKSVLIEDLNCFITSLKSQLEALSARPNQYADMWIQAAEQDEQDSLLAEKLQKELQEAILSSKELKQVLVSKEHEVVALKDKLAHAQQTILLKDQELANAKQSHDDLLQSQKTLEDDLSFQTALAKTAQCDLEKSLDCVEQLDKELDASQEKVESLEKELCTIEEQYTCLSAMSESWKIDNEQLSSALEESLAENKKLHDTVQSQSATITTLQSDVEAMLEATNLLESQTEQQENELTLRNEELEMAKCDIYRLESAVASNGIEQDAELVQALSEALEQNKELHQAIQRMESVIAEQREKLMLKGVENLGLVANDTIMMDQSSCSSSGLEKDIQTDLLDLDYVLDEFARTLRALKLADLASNVMHQKNLSQFEYFQSELQNLGNENCELQRIVSERQELVDRLIKGLQAATEKANELEKELESSKM